MKNNDTTMQVTTDLSKSPAYLLAHRIGSLGNQHRDTVAGLAARAQVSPRTIYRFMNSGISAYNPTINTLVKIAGAYKMTLSAFTDIGRHTVTRRLSTGSTVTATKKAATSVSKKVTVSSAKRAVKK